PGPAGTGSPPEGAVPGGGFTVTVAMTSLTGCSGEDFASILQALGYRMDRRPAPPPAAPVADIPAAPVTEAGAPNPSASAEPVAAPLAETETLAEAPAEEPVADAPAEAEAAEPAVATGPAEAAPAETPEAPATETPAEPA